MIAFHVKLCVFFIQDFFNKQNFHKLIKETICIIIFLVLCSSSLALGIGVSPDIVRLSSNEEKSLFISNPNDFGMNVTLSSDCSQVNFGVDSLALPAFSSAVVGVRSAEDSGSCFGSIIVSPGFGSSQGIGVLPGASVRLEMLPARSLDFSQLTPEESQYTPDIFTGFLLMSAIVFSGLYFYWRASKKSRLF
jgi:hypothetical protein